ncbi:MAG: nicotinamide-nucleotide amidohydrolase family protein, partial [Candidatus Eremiobacteraeota bacterium]|nr:nicotinamide-nucleotide amidohydrolase family protein [Candidatus Eremiobacteraeota bacterium]
VDPLVVASDGAVSERVAAQMAEGARARIGADVGIALTGVAGPGGGSEEKPVGTVWIGLDVAGDVHATRHVFVGDRDEIRYRATQFALDLVRRALISRAAPVHAAPAAPAIR